MVSAHPVPTLLALVNARRLSSQLSPHPSQKVCQAAVYVHGQKVDLWLNLPNQMPFFGNLDQDWGDSKKNLVICHSWSALRRQFHGSRSLESGEVFGSCCFLQVFLAPKNSNLVFWIFKSRRIPYHCLSSSTAGAGFFRTVQTMKEKLVVSLWFRK